ncbi:MAG: DUF2867 domain-containing protein [Caulobacteraceae bacterium]|nr:DUF2867 domain-containing protein [Caulobacteraceae bacterium]
MTPSPAVRAVRPDSGLGALLQGAQFIDAYRVGTGEPGLEARTAAQRMLSVSPAWVDALMRLRNLLVSPFGLKTPDPAATTDVDVIGIFPVVSATPRRVVLGFDDKHLDFRVVVDVANGDVTAATLVKTHNLLGRAYLATILPFHRLVVRTMLGQAALKHLA